TRRSRRAHSHQSGPPGTHPHPGAAWTQPTADESTNHATATPTPRPEADHKPTRCQRLWHRVATCILHRTPTTGDHASTPYTRSPPGFKPQPRRPACQAKNTPPGGIGGRVGGPVGDRRREGEDRWKDGEDGPRTAEERRERESTGEIHQ